MSELEESRRTSVELFAGGGGLAMGVERAGFHPLLFNEFAKYACETLDVNVSKRHKADRVRIQASSEDPVAVDPYEVPPPGAVVPIVEGDVQRIDMGNLNGRVDVLAGGPPCQPFSLGGVAKGDEDKRNMFPQMFRAVRQIQPKAVICENVRGLLRPSFKPYFDYILRELEFPFVERRVGSTWQEHDDVLKAMKKRRDVRPDERYDVVMTPVNAADYGVPQIRNRIIIVAFRSDLNVDLDTFRKFITPQYSEGALFRSILNGEYWKRHDDVPGHVRERVTASVPKNLPLDDGTKPWRTLRDAIAGIADAEGGKLPSLPPIAWDKLDRVDYNAGGFKYHVGWPGARIYDGHTPNEYDRPAKTVKAGVHGVPGGESVLRTDDLLEPDPGPGAAERYRHRYMTVRETARVMTFPDEWELAGPRGEQMRQLGNAVPVLLGEVFAKAVAAALEEAKSRA
ncbi:DNA cytosine methyltransferase [Amycolatopsis japonica]|uniref:DNA cytosine methyltransferase n=1 Tax=Amycolatopsis japonica TaxID=208439 RepID=UPI00366B050B